VTNIFTRCYENIFGCFLPTRRFIFKKRVEEIVRQFIQCQWSSIKTRFETLARLYPS